MKHSEALINKEVNEVVDRFGREAVESIILTGSFARGENSANSDMEFLTVLKPRFLKGINKPLGLEKENISIGVTSRRYLARFKPLIFTVETKYFGKVLWGDDAILESIPEYTFDDIEPLDGFVLLNNRIVEQMKVKARIDRGETISKYDIDKGYLQAMNSILAVKRRYKGTYPEKREAIIKLFSEDKELFDTVQGLLPRIEEALADFTNGYTRYYLREEALAKWRELRACIHKIWLYELSLFAIKRNMFSIPGFGTRIKGWIKVLIKPKKIKSIGLLNIMTNFFRTSPQFFIYQSAAHEYFADNPDKAKIARIIEQWEVIVK